MLSLILVNAGFNMAFAVWILNAYFSSIPVELEEAAMVDGSSRLGALLRITLPLAAARHRHRADLHVHRGLERVPRRAHPDPRADEQQPLTVAINKYIGQYSIDWGHLFAGSVIATIPVIILFALIERRVVSGLTAGSIK